MPQSGGACGSSPEEPASQRIRSRELKMVQMRSNRRWIGFRVHWRRSAEPAGASNPTAAAKTVRGKTAKRPRRSDRYGAACARGPEVIARACAEFIDMNHRLRCPLRAPPTQEALNHRAVGQTPILAKRTRNVVDTSKCVGAPMIGALAAYPRAFTTWVPGTDRAPSSDAGRPAGVWDCAWL